jgi:uncharacterized membrane protein
VLALPRWRLLLAWMTLDALVWVPRMFYYLGPSARGLPPDWFLATAVARDALVVVLMAVVVRTALRPETDPVRAVGGDIGRDIGGDDPDWPVRAGSAERPADGTDDLAPAGRTVSRSEPG